MDTERGTVSRRGVLAGAATGLAVGGTGEAAANRCGERGDRNSSTAGERPNPSGTVEVIVRLAPVDDGVLAGAESRAATVDRFRRRTGEARARFETAVGENDGVEIRREFALANAVLATVDTAAVSVTELADRDAVEAVQANRQVAAAAEGLGVHGAVETDPGDTVGGSRGTAEATHGLEMVDAPIAWEFFGTRGEGVDVAVIGTGVDPSGHDGIRASLERGGWAEFDEAGERLDNDPRDPEGHGTGVSGAIVGETTDEGVQYGVAPDANLYFARRARSYASALAAFDWVAERGADVLSLSWGPLDYNGVFARALENVRATGTLVVGSVGNAGRDTSATLGNLPTTVGVGAVDRDGAVPEWSGGERIDTDRYWGTEANDDWPEAYTVPRVTAPGVDLPFALAGGGFRTTGGTSYATPLAAGVAALVVAATGADRGVAVEDLLLEGARHPAADEAFAVDPGQDDRHGAGIVNALHAAALGNATESVGGRITDTDGDPIPGAVVGSETGPRTTTDADGRYTLDLPPGEQPIGAIALGFEVGFEVFDPARRDTFDVTLRPTEEPGADLRDGPATRIDPGDATTATFQVANVESVTVSADVRPPLSPEALSLSVDGRDAAFDDPVTFDGPRDAEALDITVETAGGPPGQVTLSVRFGGDGDPVAGELDTVYVHPDPLNIDPQVPSVQAAVDIVAPGTVLTLDSGTYEESTDGEAPGALVLDKPVSLVAAEGESPEVVADGAAEAAVFAAANDVKLADLAVDAGGADTAVRAGHGFQDRETVAPSGLTVRGNELSGAADALVTEWAPAARVEDNAITVDRVGVDVRDDQRTAVRRNEVRGGETGIGVGGAVSELTENVVRDVSEAGILVDATTFAARRMGDIAGNVVDGASAGIFVSGYAGGDIADNRLSNIEGTAIGVSGVVRGSIRDNAVDGAALGLDLAEGTVEGEVTGNEFTDVETERRGTGDPSGATGTPGASATAGPGAVDGPPEGRAPAESAADLLLYGLTAASVGVLLVPYGLRRFWRR